MHEYVYADRIIQSVLESVGPEKKVTEVKVEVGELLGLTRASLSMAYTILSKGTRAEGSKLTIRFSRGAVQCPKCGFSGRLRTRRDEHHIDPVFSCPQCGGPLKVESGLESRILEVD